MAGSVKRTFSLPNEHAAFVDRLVTSGAYASGSEVIWAGLRALQERDAAVERWLSDVVAPTYDRMKADPGRGLTAEQVAERAAKRHSDRLKAL